MAREVAPTSIEKKPARTLTPYWSIPLTGAIAYPGLLFLFSAAINWYRDSSGSFVAAVLATLIMALAVMIPVMSIRSLGKLRNSTEPKAPAIRRVLHLTFAMFPLYTAINTLASLLGNWRWANYVWVIMLMAIGGMLYFSNARGNARTTDGIVRPWLRASHGSVALLLICGFFVWHFTSHITALWSIDLNSKILDLFRRWYRSGLVEPVLLAALGFMLVSGVYMVFQYTKIGGDHFRNLQTATGVYVALFVCAHLMAVVSARQAGIDTDWYYAVSNSGHVLGYPAHLTPYYIFGVFVLLLHASLGLRIVLLSHGIAERGANRIFFSFAAIAAFVTLMIAAAMFNIHIGIA
jgi:succinate dehydrogenase/fumarate reductase cytochrome b subunit